MRAWHFTAHGKLLDGRPVPAIGARVVHDGKLELCRSGLHASVRCVDALSYAPGLELHLVELGGAVVHALDKVVATERTILWSALPAVMLEFVQLEALRLQHLWDMPQVVRSFLESGDPEMADAARAEAGWAAARGRAMAWAAAAAAKAAAEATEATRAAWAARAAGRAAQAAVEARAAAAWVARVARTEATEAAEAAQAQQEARLLEFLRGKGAPHV